MQFGDFELTTISGGTFRIDGGTMFGVVPKKLWNRVFPADERNHIAQDTHCLLVRGGGRTVLIDTGYGPKLSDKQREIFFSEDGDPLQANLAAQGVTANDVDLVIFSHLHFDHAGGATRCDESGEIVPAFPRAEYVAQKLEWEIATANWPELRGAYPQENLWPLANSGQLRLVEGDVEIVPGIRARVTGGHTAGHQALYVENGGETAVFLGDVCPTSRHLPIPWTMAYDVNMLETRRIKTRLLGEIADAGWWLLLDHDPDHAAIRIARDDRKDFAAVEKLARL